MDRYRNTPPAYPSAYLAYDEHTWHVSITVDTGLFCCNTGKTSWTTVDRLLAHVSTIQQPSVVNRHVSEMGDES